MSEQLTQLQRQAIDELKTKLATHNSDRVCLSMAACCDVGSGEALECAIDVINELVRQKEQA